jgi:hypothetical protein
VSFVPLVTSVPLPVTRAVTVLGVTCAQGASRAASHAGSDMPFHSGDGAVSADGCIA